MAKTTYLEKLQNSGDLPKIKFVGNDPKMAKRFGSGNMVIAPAIDYDEIMKQIPEGKLITSTEIRDKIAKKYGADFTCQLTAGIFINIVSNASKESELEGNEDITPYWRTLKKDGELNEKYPGGIDSQMLLLVLEGHEIIQKGKKFYVKDYENSLYKF